MFVNTLNMQDLMDKVKSPCKNICRIEDGLCIGCLRTSMEISNWQTYTDKEKKEILEEIKERRSERSSDDYYGFP